MKIGIITDTNMIKLNEKEINNDFPYLKNTKFYIDYIESLKKLSVDKELVYIMPSIVADELYNQKLSAYCIRYKSFEDSYNDISYGLKGNLPKNNYEQILNKQKKDYYSNFFVITPKLSAKLFKKTLDDSLKKIAPFDKSMYGKKSDSGFKDYMIWKSILESKFEGFEEIYFFSGDQIFKDNKSDLELEFNKKHPNTKINVEYISSDIANKQKQSLDIIINKYDLPKTEVIDLYDFNLLLKDIIKMQYTKDKDTIYYLSDNRKLEMLEINFSDFDEKDISILDVQEKENGIYNVVVNFNTKKYKDNLDLEENDKINLEGRININYKKMSSKFKLEDYTIKNVCFDYTINNFKDLIGLYDNLWHNAFSESLKKFSTALASNTVAEMSKALSASQMLKEMAEKLNEEKMQLINSFKINFFNEINNKNSDKDDR